MSHVSLSQFADRVNAIIPVMMKEFARRQIGELHKEKITLPQLLVLDFVGMNGESKMKDVAHFMRVSTAAMTGIVQRLVREHLLQRVFDPRDRRIIKVRLTFKGSELAKKINADRRKLIIRVFGKISECDRQDYLRILLQIKEILLNKNIQKGE